MNTHYDLNGLVFWSEREIQIRDWCSDYFAARLREALRATNPAWDFFQVEAPILTPRSLINPNYTDADVYATGDLVLRPETTPGTYRYLRRLLDDSNSGVRPPVCAWQVGKSFRREQDQVVKNMRLKEFYQMEFQCLYTSDTKNDYHAALQEPAARMIRDVLRLPTRIVASDRLPSYSQVTVDVEVEVDDGRWLELASISRRTDFPGKVTFQGKSGVVERELLVAEVAIGLDRCVYCFDRWAGGK